MVEFRRTVQIGWDEELVGDHKGISRPVFRELDKAEPDEPQTPNSALPDEWVDAFLRDMPNACTLYRERLRKWFEACLMAGWYDCYDSSDRD